MNRSRSIRSTRSFCNVKHPALFDSGGVSSDRLGKRLPVWLPLCLSPCVVIVAGSFGMEPPTRYTVCRTRGSSCCIYNILWAWRPRSNTGCSAPTRRERHYALCDGVSAGRWIAGTLQSNHTSTTTRRTGRNYPKFSSNMKHGVCCVCAMLHSPLSRKHVYFEVRRVYSAHACKILRYSTLACCPEYPVNTTGSSV